MLRVSKLCYGLCHVLAVALVNVNIYNRYLDICCIYIFYFKFGDSALSVMMQQNLYRQICVKRSAVGNEEMSALKYGIIYWAKVY